MTTATAPEPAIKPPRKRIRLVLLALLWVWAICIFMVIDLFFNVDEFDSLRPRSSLYRGTRVAAHKLVGEPIADPGLARDASGGTAKPGVSAPEGGYGPGPLAGGPGMWSPHDQMWGPAGMRGAGNGAGTGASATPRQPDTTETKPVFRPSPRSITPRVVNLDADLSQTGHGSWTKWNQPEGEAAEGGLVERRREGRWLWTYADGKPREERNYRRGVLHGFVRSWYADGKLQVEEEYLDGKPHGRWRAWYGGGQLAWVENWSEGVKNGDLTWFHPNGTQSLQGQYQLGKPIGEWVHRDARGNVVESRTFD